MGDGEELAEDKIEDKLKEIVLKETA